MTTVLLNAGGVVGVLMVLAAYGGIHFDRLDPKKVPALLLNLVGSALILLSMLHAFNLSAFLMEASWAAMAGFGLLKWAASRTKPRHKNEGGRSNTTSLAVLDGHTAGRAVHGERSPCEGD